MIRKLMSNKIKHDETVHVNEVTRTARGTVQWFLDKESSSDGAAHPITHNNSIKLLICGEEGFASIAADIQNAKKTIDLCCWGFDPGMELVRGEGSAESLWPRGTTYGDLLVEAGKRGVQVRLLVWMAPKPTSLSAIYVTQLNPMNLPGWTHDTNYFGRGIKQDKVGDITADKILAEHRKANTPPNKLMKMAGRKADDDSKTAQKARSAYCYRWFGAGRGIDGKFANISVISRDGDPGKIRHSMVSESMRPDETEWIGMTRYGTHHQKTVLIDYDDDDGKNAVGYVMGLNSVTDYWDTVQHEIENPRREDGSGREREIAESVQPLAPAADAKAEAQAADPDAGFRTFKPYRDYACRIRGGALIAVRKNFESAWLRASFGKENQSLPFMQAEQDKVAPPAALIKKGGKATAAYKLCARSQKNPTRPSRTCIFRQPASLSMWVVIFIWKTNTSSTRNGRNTSSATPKPRQHSGKVPHARQARVWKICRSCTFLLSSLWPNAGRWYRVLMTRWPHSVIKKG